MVPVGARMQPGPSPGEKRAKSGQVGAGRTNRHGRRWEDGETRPRFCSKGGVLVTWGGVGARKALSCQGLGAAGRVFGAWGRDGHEIMA